MSSEAKDNYLIELFQKIFLKDLFWVANVLLHRPQLVLCSLPRHVVHPVNLVQDFLHLRSDVLHHLVHRMLGILVEVLRDIPTHTIIHGFTQIILMK